MKRLVTMALAVGLLPARGQVLYNPDEGTLPQAQGWSYLSLPIPSSLALLDGSVQLGTMGSPGTLAGFSRMAPVPLDRTAGFTLHFQIRLVDEDHGTRFDRAGLSVTVLASDRKGIELGFWMDRVWAQGDSPLFTHAEEAHWEVTSFTDYALTIRDETYSLSANGNPLLTGPVRDYTGFADLVDPYETPDFLFFGDNTTSAGATIEMRTIQLASGSPTAPPLGIQLQPDGRVRVSWPVTGTFWTLVAADRLDSIAGWNPVTEPIMSNGFRNEVLLSSTDAGRFLRLIP